MKEYICKYCGEKFEKPQQVGGHVLAKHRDKSKNGNVIKMLKSIEEYNKNPILCKTCKKALPYDKRMNQFCSHSCAAKVNNKKRTKIAIYCLTCGKGVTREFYYEGKKCCSIKCHQIFQSKQRIDKWLKEGSKYPVKSKYIRNYIFEDQNCLCAICGIKNEWNGKKLIFILDHIDGNSDNNFRKNLRLVCSNCDSQLDTYKSKNKNSGRHYRKERYKEGKSY